MIQFEKLELFAPKEWPKATNTYFLNQQKTFSSHRYARVVLLQIPFVEGVPGMH